MVRKVIAPLLALTFVTSVWASVPTTLNDFKLPGSQPNQSGTILPPSDCSCHDAYDRAVEPHANWRGSMMAQAARDVLYWASVAIANQDAPSSGDLCLRCHTPKGWLEGRSEPTDGSALTADDREGVLCHFCHKSVKPSPIGVNPYPSNSAYTSSTYPADQTYLGSLTTIPAHSANGMYVVDQVDFRRGPYADADPPHNFYYSPFHQDASMCGTCHDVSNPAFSKTPGGDYEPNTFDQPAPDASPYTQFPVERTFSEWKMSAYNSAQGVYAPQFGGNKDTVRTCQDCHMRDVTGKGAKQGSVPTRSDLGLHDMTGGNTFIPLTIAAAFPGDAVDQISLDSGIARATRMLKLATSMNLSAIPQGGKHLTTVRVTNETGHKLPSGYPEGRRIWLNIKAYDSLGSLLYQSGAYDNSTAVLSHDADIKVYEIKPGISNSLAPVVSLPAGPSFHFVLNDTIYEDNRIPPRGFTNANFAAIQSPPIAHTYADGQYWDETQYQIPSAASKLIATLYYQTTTKEMVEFLRDENTTNADGDRLYTMWSTYGKSAPVVMNIDTLLLTPFGTNQAPLLASIGPKSTNEMVPLSFRVTATDGDGNPMTLTASPLPSGALFTDSSNGAGSFVWTPSYSQSGPYSVTFRAFDGQATDSEIVTITVNNVNRPPVLVSIGGKAVLENQPLAFGTSATDPDGTTTVLTASGLPSGASYTDNHNNTGSFSWTPSYTQAGIHNVLFVASDGTIADSEAVQITVSNVNRPPELAAIGAKAGAEGITLSFRISASDADSNAIILSTSPSPLGAVFTDSTNGAGSFVWTPTTGQSGGYSVTFKASDGLVVDSEVVLITINNVNQAPVLAAIGSKSGPEGSALAFGVSASDPDGTSPLLSTSELPSGAAFLDNGDGTGQFDWAPDYNQAGGHAIWFIATDENAAADSELVSITVANTNRLPVLDPIADRSGVVGQPLAFNIYGYDPDADSVALLIRNMPSGATLAENGWSELLGKYVATFNWVPSPAQEGTYSDLKAVATDLTDSTWQVFEIVVGTICCTGTTGNVNMSTSETPDLSDLSLLIAYLTVTPRPSLLCLPEANINATDMIDLSDLSLLIAYLTVSPRPTLPNCP